MAYLPAPLGDSPSWVFGVSGQSQSLGPNEFSFVPNLNSLLSEVTLGGLKLKKD